MREIKLSKGLVTQVDDEDFEWLSQWNWHAWRSNPDWTHYACRGRLMAEPDGPRKIYMHRLILNLTDQKVQADHLDGDGLNNQRSNLRVATNAQNAKNRGLYKSNTSGYTGVTFHKASGLWHAVITSDGHHISLWYFHDPKEASEVYKEAALKYHGSFAYPQDPE
jgi:hypothetical protein